MTKTKEEKNNYYLVIIKLKLELFWIYLINQLNLDYTKIEHSKD